MMNNSETHGGGSTNQPSTEAPYLVPFLYKLDQAILLLGIGKTRLYEEMNAGRIRYVTCGNRRLIPLGAVRDFVALLEAEADRQAPVCCANGSRS